MTTFFIHIRIPNTRETIRKVPNFSGQKYSAKIIKFFPGRAAMGWNDARWEFAVRREMEKNGFDLDEHEVFVQPMLSGEQGFRKAVWRNY